MDLIGPFRRLTSSQRRTFVACFLGWSLDALDYFILVFCVSAIAAEFHTKVSAIAEAIFLTLAMRPVGAFLFGRLADRYGRRPTLMINIVCYSIFELASAFAPSLPVFLVLRACFGIAMGGEWGVGAALAFETLPAQGRGFFSGLLQEGYVVGYLGAALFYGTLFPFVGWRGLFIVGALPALLVLYIRAQVDESPAWREGRDLASALAAPQALPVVAVSGASAVDASNVASVANTASPSPQPWRSGVLAHLGTFLFLAVLMFAFNSLSHGTQDLYPTFLEKNHGFSPAAVGTIAVIYNIGALLGGICFGAWSERLGRRRAIVLAALLAIPVIPLWAYATTAPLLALGGFLMQFMVQGAWGVVPAHLNELSPPSLRGTFPGLTYQLGNLLSSRNSVIQAKLVERRYAGSYPPVLALTVLLVSLLLAAITLAGREAKGADLSATR
jgi:MFS transporter, SHS family, lactate transporter